VELGFLQYRLLETGTGIDKELEIRRRFHSEVKDGFEKWYRSSI
jgi:hypothetical protein